MIVRKFMPEDFEQVLAIEMEAFTEHNPFVYMNFYEMKDEGFLVATMDTKIIGFVMGYRSETNEGRIFSLAVKKEWQNMGVGKKLLNSILDIFRDQDIRSATLEVRISNDKAIQMYRNMDFIACWVEQDYYSDGESGIIMKKQLSPRSWVNHSKNISFEVPSLSDTKFRLPDNI
ncbi:ribosomal protein S18-alanine N-acetyltransferase [Methanococcoides sp. SA1]|nr:ribosomal protein S18-alanine N-acetyltransferase [Methanococcoides sp. SA1]